eukprot:3804361-Karenia_brevis.AAC.1
MPSAQQYVSPASVQPEPEPSIFQQNMIHMLQWQVYQLMQQQQFQQVVAAPPEKPAPKPMYAAASLGKPISDSR